MSWKIILPIILFVLIAAAACGGRSELSGEERAQEPTSQAGSTLAPAPGSGAGEATSQVQPGERIDGGKLVRLLREPSTLDPHLTTDAGSATVIVEVFGGLLTIDPNLKIVPDLAESWDAPDGRTYTFHLRKDAKFHNGRLVTAHDFKWSIERAASPSTASPVVDQYLGDIVGVKEKLNGEATEISGVRVIDDHTLEITIDQPKSYFLAKLTYPTGFVLDRENVETGRRWSLTPNGTGPFRLAEYLPGESMVLARNENYHLGAPFLDSVEFILSGGTAMLMYENDEIHLTGVGLADLERLLDPGNSLNSELHNAPPQFSTEYIGLKVTEPPFDDVKVRQALNYAIDKDLIAKDVLADLVVPAKGILPPAFPGYNNDLSGYPYDPVKARELLEESKYGTGGEEFPTVFLTTAGSFGSSPGLDLEVIQEMWRENLGIQVEVLQTEYATYLQDLVKRRFDMFQIGWIADYPHPQNFLDILFYSESSNNHTAYNNPEVDSLLEAARVETREAVQYDLYRQAEEIIVQDAPWIPLWYSGEQYILIKPYVQDYFLTQLIVPKLRFVYMTAE